MRVLTCRTCSQEKWDWAQLIWALVKAPLPQNCTVTGSFAAWTLPTTFNSNGNRTKNIDYSGFLFPGIFQYISRAVLLVFKSVIKPCTQWEEIPLPFLQWVLALEGQLGLLHLSQVRVRFCGSQSSAGSGGQVRELPSAHTHTLHSRNWILIPSKYCITKLTFAFPVVPRSLNCSSNPRMPLIGISYSSESVVLFWKGALEMALLGSTFTISQWLPRKLPYPAHKGVSL